VAAFEADCIALRGVAGKGLAALTNRGGWWSPGATLERRANAGSSTFDVPEATIRRFRCQQWSAPYCAGEWGDIESGREGARAAIGRFVE
jgi:hypothetical protein